TGSGGTWYQSNSYGSNGITLIDVNGVDWGTLPSWVPDAQMMYRHVARGIAPSFDGETLDATSYNSGDQFTKCFQFNLDPTWDLTQMHIVGMLINPNGEIDNASSTSIATSIANGYHSCNSTSISDELMGPDQKLTVYPNPAVSTTTLLMTLDTEEEVSISVKSIEGKLIAKGEYGTMIGSHSLTFDVSDFAKGIYVIEAQIGNEVIVKKFIKE
ncbi:MAG: T9SS type A sorting domain-containing protein, partial [Flavobacteriales bacterium]|nr:T9SS type A sorting domain-containing protein [Flavobacteriales bacterium]